MEHPRVLVADDDDSIRHLLCTLVRREKLEVDCVGDGLEAVESLRKREYAVILLDLMMPRLDGFGVVEYLKENPQKLKPIVLIITAYADQTFKEVDSDVVSGVIRKPFEVSEIGNLIKACVTGRNLRLLRLLENSRDQAIRTFARTAAEMSERNASTGDRRDGGAGRGPGH